MIDTHYDEHERIGQIILRPNRSWTWRSNTYFIGTLLTISAIIATTFALRGFWLVLPFSALEMSALIGCLYVCVRRTHAQEVLTFSADELIVEMGHRRPERIYRFARFFTRFLVEPARHQWYRNQIAILARDERVEIGRFLPQDEKSLLVKQLRLMVHRFS
ncbi:MAG: DUF2244 domain-containing protein [Proteobacteria bacterium]|nr:DUF2244 domain-containing protein [Pseudomonadota bacterium]